MYTEELVSAHLDVYSGQFVRDGDGAELLDVIATNRTECLVCTEPIYPGSHIFIVLDYGEVFHSECVEVQGEIDE